MHCAVFSPRSDSQEKIVRRSSSDTAGLYEIRDGLKKYVISILAKSFCLAPGEVCPPKLPGESN